MKILKIELRLTFFRIEKDVNECSKLEKNLKINDICQTGPLFMGTCVNVCGNYTCECKDTQKTIVDIYDPKKCYSSKNINKIKF